jgi:hypothetical protein
MLEKSDTIVLLRQRNILGTLQSLQHDQCSTGLTLPPSVWIPSSMLVANRSFPGPSARQCHEVKVQEARPFVCRLQLTQAACLSN